MTSLGFDMKNVQTSGAKCFQNLLVATWSRNKYTSGWRFRSNKKYWLVAGCQKRAISHVKKHQPNMFWPNLKPHHADIRRPRDTGYKYAQLTFHEWGCNEGGS
jgi:hypothetical protein